MTNKTKELLTPSREAVILDYVKLAHRPTLSNRDQERLEEILELTLSDNVLSFLLAEVDVITSRESNSFDEMLIEKCQNQLRESLYSLPKSPKQSLKIMQVA
jgi:hypothetical protein